MGSYVPDLDVAVRLMSRDPIPQEELERHLHRSWGFDTQQSAELAREATEFQVGPGLLYTYVKRRGRRWE